MRWLRSGTQHEKGPDQPLEPVRILTPDLALNGFVAPTGQRITDILLRGQDLAFLPAGADPDPANWVLIAPTDLLVVIPPPLGRRRGWQERVERRGAAVLIGPYRVTGKAHLRPGEPLDQEFRARQPFLPLTEAAIQGADGSTERVDVAIVNLNNSAEFGPAD